MKMTVSVTLFNTGYLKTNTLFCFNAIIDEHYNNDKLSQIENMPIHLHFWEAL